LLTAEITSPNSSGVRTPTKLSSSDSEGAVALRSAIAFWCHGVVRVPLHSVPAARALVAVLRMRPIENASSLSMFTEKKLRFQSEVIRKKELTF
jgi:hypothetical protein